MNRPFHGLARVHKTCKGRQEFCSVAIARNAHAGVPNSLLCRERGRRGKFLFIRGIALATRSLEIGSKCRGCNWWCVVINRLERTSMAFTSCRARKEKAAIRVQVYRPLGAARRRGRPPLQDSDGQRLRRATGCHRGGEGLRAGYWGKGSSGVVLTSASRSAFPWRR
jgi:hypothetical protein